MELLIADHEVVSCGLRPVYFLAGRLRDAGAPIEFNSVNVDLVPEDIHITGDLSEWYDPATATTVYKW